MPYNATSKERAEGRHIPVEQLRDGKGAAPKAAVAWAEPVKIPLKDIYLAMLVRKIAEQTDREMMELYNKYAFPAVPEERFRRECEGSFKARGIRSDRQRIYADPGPKETYTLEPTRWAQAKLFPFVLWHEVSEPALAVLLMLLIGFVLLGVTCLSNFIVNGVWFQ